MFKKKRTENVEQDNHFTKIYSASFNNVKRITITVFLDIIHVLFLFKTSSCFYLKHDISENGFFLSLQVEPTRMDPTDRASP